MRQTILLQVVLPALLISGAGLKLYGVSVSTASEAGWLGRPGVQLATAEWELLLGAWLLSGVAPRAAWFATLGTFLAFAGVSGYLGWVGMASCGCFGALRTTPWWAFGIDLAVLVLLAFCRPLAGAPGPAGLRGAGVWLGSVSLACGLLFAASGLYFRSAEVALAKLRGESLSVAPYVDLGLGRTGDTLQSSVTVTNFTDEPVRLIGGTTDCTCATVDDFPLTIPPGGQADFRVRLNVLPGSSGQLTREVRVQTTCPAQPMLLFRIGCRVEG